MSQLLGALPPPLVYLYIFLARVIDVGLGTLRILMLMRGKSFFAAAFGFIEIVVYIGALGAVIGNLSNIYMVLTFALGFAAGNFLGSFLEEKLAIGFCTVQVVSLHDKNGELEAALRQKGFGVTVLDGCGKDGPHPIINVLLKRRDLPCCLQLARARDPRAFVTVMDTRQIWGGFFPTVKRK